MVTFGFSFYMTGVHKALKTWEGVVSGSILSNSAPCKLRARKLTYLSINIFEASKGFKYVTKLAYSESIVDIIV